MAEITSPSLQQEAGSFSIGGKSAGVEERSVPKPHNGTQVEEKDGDAAGTSNRCLSHHKNDSGSYDIPPNGLSANSGSETVPSSSGVTILVSNGELSLTTST